MYTLRREQRINRPLEEVFGFFEQPENLAAITPPDLGFEILTPTPIEMREGALIDYRVNALGLPMHWTTLICEYEPPFRFVDTQLKGPYTFWHHTHTFEEINGATIMRDEVRYELPLWWLGRLMHSLVVQRQLNRIFDFRARTITAFFDGSQDATEPLRSSARRP